MWTGESGVVGKMCHSTQEGNAGDSTSLSSETRTRKLNLSNEAASTKVHVSVLGCGGGGTPGPMTHAG